MIMNKFVCIIISSAFKMIENETSDHYLFFCTVFGVTLKRIIL